MCTFVKNYVKGCAFCQQFKINRHPTKLALMPIPGPTSTHPFAQISMDFVTDLPPVWGLDSIFSVVDHSLTKGKIFSTFHSSTDSYRNPQESSGIFRNSDRNPQESSGIDRNPQESTGMGRNPQEWAGIHRNGQYMCRFLVFFWSFFLYFPSTLHTLIFCTEFYYYL